MKPTKINFNLRNQENGLQPIIICITGNLFAKRIRFSSGLSVEPKMWDGNKQRMKHQYINAKLINPQLNSIAQLLPEYIAKKTELEKVLPTLEMLSTYVKVELLKRKPKYDTTEINTNTLLVVLLNEAFKILTTSTTETGTGQRKKSTLQKHIQAIASIKAYVELKHNNFAVLSTVTDAFLSGFKQFLSNGYSEGDKVFKAISDGTIQKHLRCIKQLITTIVDDNKGILKLPENCLPGLDKSWKIKGINSDRRLVLTVDEIEQIENVDLEPLSSQAIARDTFLMMYYTGGQRISDISTLNDSIQSDVNIHMVQKKTQNYIKIEKAKEVKAILSQYGGSFPEQAAQTRN